jgi:hypothetical protein
MKGNALAGNGLKCLFNEHFELLPGIFPCSTTELPLNMEYPYPKMIYPPING